MTQAAPKAASAATAKSKRSTQTLRTNDLEAAALDTVDVATQEFASKGLSGACIDEITAFRRTSKRMTYHHFGSKEGLYVRVLEAVLKRIRNMENGPQRDGLPPEVAMRVLVGFTFDQQVVSPDFIRLVMNENMNKGCSWSSPRQFKTLICQPSMRSPLSSSAASKQGGFAVLLMPWTCTCRSALCAFPTRRTNTRFHSSSNSHLTLPTALPALAPMLTRRFFVSF